MYEYQVVETGPRGQDIQDAINAWSQQGFRLAHVMPPTGAKVKVVLVFERMAQRS